MSLVYCPVLHWGTEGFGGEDVDVGRLGIWTVYRVSIWRQQQQHAGSSGAEQRKRVSFGSSIAPLIMRQHGSGCAAMATVFH